MEPGWGTGTDRVRHLVFGATRRLVFEVIELVAPMNAQAASHTSALFRQLVRSTKLRPRISMPSERNENPPG